MLRTMHRYIAGMILLFIALHFLNHLVGIFSLEGHLKFMEWIRPLYRNQLIEPVLLFALFAQLLIGLILAIRSRGKGWGIHGKLQVISGCYLIFFLVNHTSAALFTRSTMQLDTNFYFAAAGMHFGQMYLFFVPYYFLGVLALFTHLGCVLRSILIRRGVAAANRYFTLTLAGGAIFAALVVMSLAGLFYPVAIPEEYFVVYARGE